MGSSCCTQKKSSEFSDSIAGESNTKESKNGVQNLGYVDFNSSTNTTNGITNTSTAANLNELPSKSEDQIIPALKRETSVNNYEKEGTTKSVAGSQNNSFTEKDVKRYTKSGVTFADTVDIIDSTKGSSSKNENLIVKPQSTFEQKPILVPKIVVEDVDTFAHKNQLNNENKIEEVVLPKATSASYEETIDEKYKELFDQPSYVLDTDVKNSTPSKEYDYRQEEHNSGSFQTQMSTEEEDAEYRRISSHLKNVADNVQKLGSLIDRFDGVFMPLLHDEIEHNLRFCNQSALDAECLQYDNLVKRQQEIQQKVQSCLIILDAKSEKPTPVSVQAVSENLQKLKELEEKVDTVCLEVDKLEETSQGEAYQKVVDNLQAYHDELKTVSSEDDEELLLKTGLQEKIQTYLKVLEEKLRTINSPIKTASAPEPQTSNDIVVS